MWSIRDYFPALVALWLLLAAVATFVALATALSASRVTLY
jgi:uncharacterized membrane protein (GlpM family)